MYGDINPKEAVMQAYRLLSAGDFTEVKFPGTHINLRLCEFSIYKIFAKKCQ